MLPESSDGGIGSQPIGREVGERTENADGEDEWQADPPRTLQKVGEGPLATQAGRREQAGQEKHQRHQADVLPRAKQVEAEPALPIENRKCDPAIGRRVELKGMGWL